MTYGCLGFLIVAAAAVLVGTCGGEMVQSRRAFDATTQCEAQMKEPRRQLLSTKVVCVPIKARQDTSTVRLNVEQP